jgi:hypothetical protein
VPESGPGCRWEGPGHACDFCKQQKITCNLSGPMKKRRAAPEDRLGREMPRKKAQTEVPGVCRPSVVIEMVMGEWLLWEMLACNLCIARATEEEVEVLQEVTRGFWDLAAI